MARAFDRLTTTMRSLCYEPGFVTTRGDSPAALGNRIAAAAIASGRSDGSLEREHYADASYVPENAPLVVTQPGTPMHDATFWQPLAFGQIVIQGGLPIPAEVQTFVGSQWGHVRGFALTASKPGLPSTPGRRPSAFRRPVHTSVQRWMSSARARESPEPRSANAGLDRKPLRAGGTRSPTLSPIRKAMWELRSGLPRT